MTSARDIETVKAASLSTGESLFGVTKAFVSDVHAELVRTGRCTMSLDGFKAWLVRAQRFGEINLSRCDLVEAHDANKVEQSEMTNGVSEWHFIRV